MPAKSQSQQKFMGMVHALNKGDIKPSDVSKSVKDVAKTIKKSDAKDFASTKHSGIPKKVKQEILDALKEYANKMSGNKHGGSGSYGYAPQKGLRDDDGYDDEGKKESSKYRSLFYTNEASRGEIFKAAKRGSYPATVVVSQVRDMKSKVIKQVTVKTPAEAPATIKVLQKKYPKGDYKISLEDRTGKIIFKEGMFSTLDQIRQDSKDVRDFVKNVFKDRDFIKMKNDKEFIKYLKSIYEGVDESKGVPQNYMQGRTSDYHTALRGKNRDYSGGTNFKKKDHGQPDIEKDDEDQETNSLSVKQTPIKENYMMNSDVEEEMKKHGIKKIPIDSHGVRLLKGLKKEKFINKIDNKLKLTYFYATVPKGQRYNYASLKKPLSPLFDRFMNYLMGENISLTAKMAAYRVSQNIVDMYNNGEEIDSPYYMLKNYFNSFGMDTNRSRTFNGAQYHLEQWLKRNKKYEKAMMREEKANLKPLPEYGQRLDLSYIEDEEAKLKGTPKSKDAIDRDIEEYSGGSYEYTKGDQYGQNSVNEIGIFPVTNYMDGIIPSDFIDTTTRQKKERLKSTLRDLKSTLNNFWKQHKIPYRIK